MDGWKGLQQDFEFNEVIDNQRVGGHPSSSSTISSTAVMSFVISTCLIWACS